MTPPGFPKPAATSTVMNMQCGCQFIDGLATKLCDKAAIKDGILFHGGMFVQWAELSDFDRDFLKDLKVTA